MIENKHLNRIAIYALKDCYPIFKMAPKRKLKVLKVPLGYKQEYKSINFGPMPQLYLDLIENKEKVKVEMKDQLYEPKWDDNESHYLVINNEEVKTAGEDFQRSVQEFVVDAKKDLAGLNFNSFNMHQRKSGSPSYTSQPEESYYDEQPPKDDFLSSVMHEGFDKPHSEVVSDKESPHGSYGSHTYIPEQPPSRRDKLISNKPASPASFTKVEEDEFIPPQQPVKSKEPSRESSRHDEPRSHRRDERREYEERPSREDERYERRDERRDRRRDDDYYEEDRRRDERRDDRRDRRRHEEDDDEIGAFLASDMPEEPKPSQNVYRQSNRPAYREEQPRYHQQQERQQERSYAPPPQQQVQSHRPRPPGLDEINRTNANRTGTLDLKATSKSDEDRSHKRSWLLYQFNRLRRMKNNTTIKIPEFSEYVEVDTLQREYDTIVKQLKIESNVVNYKRYLTMGFGVMEFLVGRFLKLEEISGFAQDQMIKMNQYEEVLYEIGEKHQPDPSKKGMPPELKLIGIIIFNAAIFVVMKSLLKGVGNSVLSSTILKNEAAPAASTASKGPQVNNAPGRKPMKEPDINFEEFE